MANMTTLVEQTMKDLLSLYGLTPVEVSDQEVLLRAATYAIDVFADRDGVSAVYFDIQSNPIRGYNLPLFFINKRRDALALSKPNAAAAKSGDFRERQLNSLAQHLRSAGQDILGGSKDWIKEYSWPAVQPTREVAALI